MRNYRDLEVWAKAHTLTKDLYRKSRAFPKEEFCGLTSQLRRAAVSIGANLAEGCGRQTTAELARFVRIAMGSASEPDYHLLLAHDFGYLRPEDHRELSQKLTRIRKMLAALLATLESGGKARKCSGRKRLNQAPGAWPRAKSQEPRANVQFVATIQFVLAFE